MKFKLIPLIVLILQTLLFSQYSTDLFDELPKMKSFTANRVSSYDTTGGNLDRISIASGETVQIADIKGPAVITHIWITVAAEPFYSGKIVWRMYWDGEKHPSVEAPLGDFFGVGHGIDRNYASLPFTVTANGKARNCYFPMPFRKSARIEVTNEGKKPVTAFYYYIDYQVHEKLDDDVAYFHAHYRQEMPCKPNQNYMFLDAKGAGHYVGVNLSIMNTKPGWWGEGDDMIYVDGETDPTFHGTGSEDYFCDAWGMRESHSLFYGCPIQERDFGIGAKATVYRFHIPDPIPFKNSIRVTIEHGHANDRADLFSSVAYWYQQEPHAPFPPLPTVSERLPYALELSQYSSDFSSWKCIATTAGDDCSADSGLYYYHDGARAKFGILDFDQEDDFAIFRFPVPYSEKYDVSLSVVTGNDFGRTKIELEDESVEYDGYSEANHRLKKIPMGDLFLKAGQNTVRFEVIGKNEKSTGYTSGLHAVIIEPRAHYAREWMVIGPFDNPNAGDGLFIEYPPEKEIDLNESYSGKNGVTVKWQKFEAEEDGYINLIRLHPNQYTVAYGLTHIKSPESRAATILLGSNDGVKLWLNDELVHEHVVKRGAKPDQDRIEVQLNKGWNKVLIKVEQGGSNWGYYFRILDPEYELQYRAVK